MSSSDRPKHVGVFVLGEIGRSPRMQYHALSISRLEPAPQVHFIGLRGPAPLQDLQNQPNVSFVHIKPWWLCLPRSPCLFPVIAPLKLIIQTLCMILALFSRRLDFLIVQNPPALPTLPVIFLYSILVRRCRVIIDWHNFGYTLLALRRFVPSCAVWVAKILERLFGACSRYRHICVSNTMRDWLQTNWGVTATTLYDKPAHIFREMSPQEKYDFVSRFWSEDLASHLFRFVAEDDCSDEEVQDSDPHTPTAGSLRVAERDPVDFPSRPRILVSSTSWTQDEDFNVLLCALILYDLHERTPPLFVVITGKGPMKEFYEAEIERRAWKKVSIRLAWLPMEDYPRVLGIADVGVSLHYSSSGIDLPMKVVDMFGCCLPVCAIEFEALHELVVDGVNGCVFQDQATLFDRLLMLFVDRPDLLNVWRKNLRGSESRWEDEWEKISDWFQ